MSEPQTVYFDPDDAEMDGLGWNVIGDWDSAVAARFDSREAALRFCEALGFTVSSVEPQR